MRAGVLTSALLVCVLSGILAVPADAATAPSLSFAPNEGQADPSARFVARSRHGAVLIGPTATTVILARRRTTRRAC